MPARKNKPGKFGTSAASTAPLPSHLERELVDKLIVSERANPHSDHYVGWPDMDAAEGLVRKGYLVYGGRATGCFCITDLFRHAFLYGSNAATLRAHRG